MPLSGSKLLRIIAMKVFKEADLDDSGTLDVKELHVAMLMVYDKLNQKLPCRIDPPEHGEIKSILKRYDYSGDGVLSKEEFVDCVNNLVGCTTDRGSLFDSIAFRVIKKHIIKIGIIPVAALGVKALVHSTTKSRALDKLPEPIFHNAVEGIGNITRASIMKHF